MTCVPEGERKAKYTHLYVVLQDFMNTSPRFPGLPSFTGGFEPNVPKLARPVVPSRGHQGKPGRSIVNWPNHFAFAHGGPTTLAVAVRGGRAEGEVVDSESPHARTTVTAQHRCGYQLPSSAIAVGRWWWSGCVTGWRFCCCFVAEDDGGRFVGMSFFSPKYSRTVLHVSGWGWVRCVRDESDS